MNNFIKKYTNEFVDVLNNLDEEKLAALYDLLNKTKETNNKVFMLGNGGSSASASHWVCDFNKGTNHEDSKRLQVYSLSDNTPLFSAVGNDFSYEDVFVEQLKNYLSPGDLVIGLSVSGNSENIVRALKYANEIDADTYSIVGNYDGGMIDASKESLIVPSKNYGVVEDIHMYVCHLLSQYMYEENVSIAE